MRDGKKTLAVSMREFNQRLVFDLLDKHEGTKAIVWDRMLMKQLNVIVWPRILEDHGVTKMATLDEPVNAQQLNVNHVVYLVAPFKLSVEKLLRNYLTVIPRNDLRQHHVLFVPTVTYALREKLKSKESVMNRVESVTNLPLHWFPTDHSHFLALSQAGLPRSMLIDGDWNHLHQCALALLQLEMRMDGVPTIRCKGHWSAKTVEILNKMRTSNEEIPIMGEHIDIEEVILIDRWLDPLTPLLTQFAFAGAIDELFPIDVQGKIKVPSDELESDTVRASGGPLKEIALAGDVYEALQDLHVRAVAGKIVEILAELKEADKQRESLRTVADYKTFIEDKLTLVMKKKASAGLFTDLATLVQSRFAEEWFNDAVQCERDILHGQHRDRVIPFIENALIEARPPQRILRLIAVQSLVGNGLKAATLQAYRRLFVQSYGVMELDWWIKLQMAGLLREDSPESKPKPTYASMNFPAVSKRLRLLASDVDEAKPEGTSYAYNGYASALVRYIEEGLANGWQDYTTIRGTIPTPEKREPRRLVFVIGGLTRSEVAALQLLSKRIDVCTSTAIINGNSFIEAFKN